MPAGFAPGYFDSVSRRWHALAERRRAYFIELYRSGRWTRYYTREDFAVLMRDVLDAERKWCALAGDRGARDEAQRPAA